MSSWANIATEKPKEIEVEKPEEIEIQPEEYHRPKKSFNVFFRANILRTKCKKYTSFENWEYQYFYHLTKLFDILASHLENQD